MISRRTFLGSAAASLVAPTVLRAADGPRKKLAVVTNIWNYHSHAWHMAERFLHGYPVEGKWHQPPFEVVAAYVDQVPKNDLSRDRAKQFGFTIYPTIAETLRCGGKSLAVDAVLLIGEHGDYPVNEFHQILYPRYVFFKQMTDVFAKDGRTAPIFNDKHLSWKWDHAKEMVDTSKKMGFAFAAGSSLPVTWRLPAVDVPHGAKVEEIVVVAHGDREIYGFHGLEALQCLAERRHGGETGVKAVHAIRGDAFWEAMAANAWSPRLFEACLCRSHTLAQLKDVSHRYPTVEQMKAWAKDPIAFRLEYTDGLKATLLMVNGVMADFTAAVKLTNENEPLSTLFHLPPNPNVVYSAALMSKAEETFTTGRSPCPIERTLLTSGILEAGLQSLVAGERKSTPHLAVRYEAGKESLFARS
jgi:hypothetical protein